MQIEIIFTKEIAQKSQWAHEKSLKFTLEKIARRRGTFEKSVSQTMQIAYYGVV